MYQWPRIQGEVHGLINVTYDIRKATARALAGAAIGSAMTKKEIEARKDTIMVARCIKKRRHRRECDTFWLLPDKGAAVSRWLARCIQSLCWRLCYSLGFSREFKLNILIVSRFWIYWYIFIMSYTDYASAKIISLHGKKHTKHRIYAKHLNMVNILWK